jgi:hypothetical protein
VVLAFGRVYSYDMVLRQKIKNIDGSRFLREAERFSVKER